MRLSILLVAAALLLVACGGSPTADTSTDCTPADVDARLREIQTGAWRDFANAANGWTTQKTIGEVSESLPAVKAAREKLAAENWTVCGVDVKPHALAAADAAISGMEAAIAGDKDAAMRHYDTSRAEMQLLDTDWAKARAAAD